MFRHQTLISTLLFFPLFLSQLTQSTNQMCSSSCGDITNITYPFRLTTDPPNCGDPDYEFQCQDNKTLLNYHSGKYFVKQINYDTQVLRLIDINIANNDSTCISLPYKSVSVDELVSDPRYRGGVSNTVTSFIKCRTNLSDLAGYRRVPCLSDGEVDGGDVYVSYNTFIISDLRGSCEFLSMVPTIYQNVMNPSYENIVRLMKEGFDLGWSVACRDCVGNGESCMLSSWDTPYVYECYRNDMGVYSTIGDIIYAIWNILWLRFIFIGRFVVAPLVVLGFLIHKYVSMKKMNGRRAEIELKQDSLIPKRHSYADIVAITQNFKSRLGQAGFGTVYKGELLNGNLVAVKMLANSMSTDDDFVNEVRTMTRVNHINVIKLMGFCSEGPHHALVFEYMPRGSVDKFVSSRAAETEPFSWEKLLHIALGTARGIEHLHTGTDVCILHCDIKPQNVLLDQNLVPKVSDFGLAKFLDKDQGHDRFLSVNSRRGTMGYIAPELISSTNPGTFSCKSDVYSYGMLLLEMVRKRRKVDSKGNSGKEMYFPLWVYDRLNEGGDLELDSVAPTQAAIAKKLCIVGLCCIQKEVSERPSMTKVVEMLVTNTNDLQLPLSPLSFPDYATTMESQSDSSTELLITVRVEH